MSDLKNYLDKQLQDKEFKEEWETLEPEFSVMQAMIDARKSAGLTQKQLSEKTGISFPRRCGGDPKTNSSSFL